MSIDFEKFAQNNDFETTLEESKKYYSAISKDGELQNLIAGSVVRYKNSLNKILIDKSASRLKFNGTSEVIAAKNYIEGVTEALDNLPEVKKIIDENNFTYETIETEKTRIERIGKFIEKTTKDMNELNQSMSDLTDSLERSVYALEAIINNNNNDFLFF